MTPASHDPCHLLIRNSGGCISFERFMEFALHDPTHGYYARRISQVGTRGDFTTAAEISPALAKAIAAWATTNLKRHRVRHLIEVGPGNGTLAAAVRKNLPFLTRWRTTIHLVDSSAPLRTQQQQQQGLRGVIWHDSMASALDACHGRACIYSNELLDAFPVRVVRHDGISWQELHLTIESNKLTETWINTDPINSPTPPLKHRREIPQAAASWLQTWMNSLEAGSMLHIDYGHHRSKMPRLSAHGSLRGYLLHQRMTGSEIYQNIGRMDLTADVDFDYLSQTIPGSSHIITQHDFLKPFVHPAHPGDLQASDPSGAGSAFLVWEYNRNAKNNLDKNG